jgi:hypothetical protein
VRQPQAGRLPPHQLRARLARRQVSPPAASVGLPLRPVPAAVACAAAWAWPAGSAFAGGCTPRQCLSPGCAPAGPRPWPQPARPAAWSARAASRGV